MNFSELFIRRPVATYLLALGLLISGMVAFNFLPVAPLPNVEFPTIAVFASRPGADPETMANSIAAPLERHLGEIPGVSELTSTSSVGSTTIIIQFDLKRDVDGAAHDVQAAINAATQDLPADIPTRPFFRKFNPADQPVMTIAMTSDTLSPATLFDAADSVLAQRLSQIEGVAQVGVNGAEKPAVRVRLDPAALAAAGLSGQDVYTAIRQTNVNGALGGFDGAEQAETLGLNGQLSKAAEYRSIIVKSVNGAVVRLQDVASVIDGVANVRLAAWFGKKPAILLSITKTAGANVIETVDRVNAALPLLRAWIPPDIEVTVLSDRTDTIRASVFDIEVTLVITIGLVLLVVFLFMRRLVPTLAAGLGVPLSLSGTVAVMWFLGFSLNNFTLMALTIAVGFVVDDSIVMVENIVRFQERGLRPFEAALRGARQIGFTVMSISISLVAVFIPILFMGGVLGKILHEFATTLTIAIAVSAVVSLSLTPMMCARYNNNAPMRENGWSGVDRVMDRAFSGLTRFYARTLGWALRLRWLMLLVTFAVMGLTVWLYMVVPKGFLPTQDTGLLAGGFNADPNTSFAAMREKQGRVLDILLADPAIEAVGSTIGVSSGWSAPNRGQLLSIRLAPPALRQVSAEQVMTRLRPKLNAIGGLQVYLYAVQDLRGGGRGGQSNQFVLLGQDLNELREWTLKVTDRLRAIPEITDVTSDQDRAAPQLNVVIDRVAAARLGVSVSGIDNALNNAFAQRQISIIYGIRNQYRVVEETLPALQTDPAFLDRVKVGARGGIQIPIGAVVRFERGAAPLAVNHQGLFPAATISFNIAEGVPQSIALQKVTEAAVESRLPETIRTQFAGNARFLADSLASQPVLIAAAFLTIYIVLGVLYESLTQPITIISTLPSAGLGALLAMVVTGTDFSIMGIIGILLLMGIVKKNAIMLVDFALEEERDHGRTPAEAIHAACLERFRPIIMTTLAALLGALPLALAWGTGSELRKPLGISIVGGLLVSQILTLYTTPVIYLFLQRRRRASLPRATTPTQIPGE